MSVKKIAGICCVLFLVQGLCAVAPAMSRCGTETGRPASGGDSLQAKVTHMLGFVLKPGFLFPTDEFFKGANNAQKRINSTLSGHIEYGFRFSPYTETGRLYPHAVQGIGIGYNTFFCPSEMGNPLSVYVFQTSRIASITPRLSFDYEWNFGASFGWKPHDEETNPKNTVVGSRINAYINLGVFFNWQLSSSWNLTAGIDLTHYSNGNTRYPNGGVNTMGARLGVVRSWGEEGQTEGGEPASVFRPHWSYDVLLYGAARTRGLDWEGSSYLLPGKFGIIGLNVAPMYHFTKNLAAGISLDGRWDEGGNLKEHLAGIGPGDDIKFYRPPFREQIVVGLSARGEWTMPVFSVNVGVGYNCYRHGDDAKGLYQVLALKAFFTRSIFLHVGYQLQDFHDPNNLMLGIGYRFH